MSFEQRHYEFQANPVPGVGLRTVGRQGEGGEQRGRPAELTSSEPSRLDWRGTPRGSPGADGTAP